MKKILKWIVPALLILTLAYTLTAFFLIRGLGIYRLGTSLGAVLAGSWQYTALAAVVLLIATAIILLRSKASGAQKIQTAAPEGADGAEVPPQVAEEMPVGKKKEKKAKKEKKGKKEPAVPAEKVAPAAPATGKIAPAAPVVEKIAPAAPAAEVTAVLAPAAPAAEATEVLSPESPAAKATEVLFAEATEVLPPESPDVGATVVLSAEATEVLPSASVPTEPLMAAPAAPVPQAFCTRCGTALPSGAKFCNKCGNKVGG